MALSFPTEMDSSGFYSDSEAGRERGEEMQVAAQVRPVPPQ